VDTTFLSDDIYPKVPAILRGIAGYEELVSPLLATKIPKSKKVFDNAKVTDHHAIIPTGERADNMQANEFKVYDLITRRFIAAFYPNCKIATTTVLGEVNKVEFKVTGKQILAPGWRVVFEKQTGTQEEKEEETDKDDSILPAFEKGESGPHLPVLNEKWTQPPKYYTEATLLRAMETAGKLVDDDELRDALKENGIGRPSTRAAIIETLFKRNYIRKERKSLYATQTGVELIGTIKEELLKSAELTGIWEKKLRQIEKNEYDTRQFIDELKQMLTGIVNNVKNDWGTTITIEEPVKEEDKPKEKSAGKKKAPSKKKETDRQGKSPVSENAICPLCKKGRILKGKTAYGCSGWKSGCTFRMPFDEAK
jgi:DNA topoisomerase-3